MTKRNKKTKLTPWQLFSGACVVGVTLFVGSAMVAGIYEGVTKNNNENASETKAVAQTKVAEIKVEEEEENIKKPWVIGQIHDGFVPKAKVLGAGNYTVGGEGDHLIVGRYKVTNIGSGSNFVVRDGFGNLKVNTILGRSGSEDYTFEADAFDKIETRGRVKFTPCK